MHPMNEIHEYLKQHREALDTEIANATGITLRNVHIQLKELAAKSEVMVCHSIRFVKGEKVEGILCRIAGYTPPATPGRRSKVQLKLS